MVTSNMKFAALAFAFVCAANATTLAPLAVCQNLAEQISSSSDVIYPDNLLTLANFTSDTHHWFQSSSQTPTCILEAGSAQDVSIAMKLIAANQTPFAVKSGGHASGVGFSSTTGLLITFSRMTQVNVSADKSTVEIGMGQTWAGVYEALESSGVNVAGGRVPGPGCGGVTLGGGFSWKTNQYGLTADTVQSFNIVLPNGTFTTVDSSQADLSFALRGGLNRFGVVTSVVYNALPQVPLVYGGFAIYPDAQGAVDATTTFYQTNTDPKAQIITTLNGGETGSTALVLFFYDGPSKPASFAPFDALIPLLYDVTTQPFSKFVSGIPSLLEVNNRGTFDTISTSKITQGFANAVLNETEFYGQYILSHGSTYLSFDIEPFLDTYGGYSVDTAYPHSDSPLPLNFYWAWASADEDEFWYNAIKTSKETLIQVAINEGIYRSDFTAYPNYAIPGTSATDLYGATNAARLASIRQQVDPDSIMSLTGGFPV